MLPGQMLPGIMSWYSHCIFVINFSNFNPAIRILSFLDSAKAGMLKNVQNYFLRCLRSREMSKTKVGTFFKHPVVAELTLDEIVGFARDGLDTSNDTEHVEEKKKNNGKPLKKSKNSFRK